MTLIRGSAKYTLMWSHADGRPCEVPQIGTRLDIPGGACVLFDPTRMKQDTEECEKICTPSEVTWMGVALHCRQDIRVITHERPLYGGHSRFLPLSCRIFPLFLDYSAHATYWHRLDYPVPTTSSQLLCSQNGPHFSV